VYFRNAATPDVPVLQSVLTLSANYCHSARWSFEVIKARQTILLFGRMVTGYFPIPRF